MWIWSYFRNYWYLDLLYRNVESRIFQINNLYSQILCLIILLSKNLLIFEYSNILIQVCLYVIFFFFLYVLLLYETVCSIFVGSRSIKSKYRSIEHKWQIQIEILNIGAYCNHLIFSPIIIIIIFLILLVNLKLLLGENEAISLIKFLLKITKMINYCFYIK